MKNNYLIFLLIGVISIMSACSISSMKGKINAHKETALMYKDPVPIDFISQDLTIVSIGDSLTEGVGDSTGNGGYLPYLQRQLETNKKVKQANFYNLGVKGNRTDQLLRRLEDVDVRRKIAYSDIVIMTIGGNDVMKVVRENFSHLKLQYFHDAIQPYTKNLDAIFKKIREINNDTMIVLVGFYNPFSTWFSDLKEMDEIVEMWNDASQSVLSTYDHSYFVEIADLFQFHGENLLYSDYFHPNDQGYELIADRLYEKLDDDVMDAFLQRNLAISQGETSNE